MKTSWVRPMTFSVALPLLLAWQLAIEHALAQSVATTRRVSVASDGTQADGHTRGAAISGSGRSVSFSSLAGNLISEDILGVEDIFVHDLATGQTSRLSVGWDGSEANDSSLVPVISADGRFVAFDSFASNLVPGDTNRCLTTSCVDIFVHDRQTGQTTRVSVRSDGSQALDGDSVLPAISADGRFVVFNSFAPNLVMPDTNNDSDVFVHDRQAGETTRVSVSSDGTQGNGRTSYYPAISADGRFVAFDSEATNLAPGDTNGIPDVFVHDRRTGQTTRVSVASDGSQALGSSGSSHPALSADGRFVAFNSFASNLVPATN